MIFGITLIILGLLAAPSLLLAKKPDAKEILNKIAPYQGWIGLAFCLNGVWGIITSILNLGWITDFPIWWVTLLASSLLQSALGFLLGYALIVKYILSKNEEAKKKGEELLTKLAPMQGKIGLAGVAVGIWTVVANILFR